MLTWLFSQVPEVPKWEAAQLKAPTIGREYASHQFSFKPPRPPRPDFPGSFLKWGDAPTLQNRVLNHVATAANGQAYD